jgi:hypothetical protein
MINNLQDLNGDHGLLAEKLDSIRQFESIIQHSSLKQNHIM